MIVAIETLSPDGVGGAVAVDLIDGKNHQLVKMEFGEDGTSTMVSATDPMPVAAVGELIHALEAQRLTLMTLAGTIGQAMPDAAGRLRVVIDNITAALTLATITTVGTVTTVTTVSTVTTLANQTNIGGLSADPHIRSMMALAEDTLRSRITIT